MLHATPSGSALKAAGMATAVAAAPVWSDKAEEFVNSLPYGSRITAEDITAAIGWPGRGHRAVGGVIYGLARAGLLEHTGEYVRATRPERHSGMLAVWRVL